MREAAPPYRGESPHALWHVSEDATIRRFEPHLRPGHDATEPLVWAIDTRHLPLYWFPRECPRATFWAESETSADDLEHFLDGDHARRVHAIEAGWLGRVRSARVVAYRMPAATFEQDEDRFWVSREPVEPLELVELGDLLALHADAAIELRLVPALLPLWERVVDSTLGFSGIRLRNAVAAR